LRESVLAAVGPNAAAGQEAILGILSLIIWALILIVTVKYVIIVLRADNNGEGGTLALMALAHRALGGKSLTIILLGMISAALFYGDAMITPALSVLSGVGGLEVITRPSLAMSFRFRLSSCLPCLRCSHGTLQGSPPSSAPSRSCGSRCSPSAGLGMWRKI
jgi:K+ transporter